MRESELKTVVLRFFRCKGGETGIFCSLCFHKLPGTSTPSPQGFVSSSLLFIFLEVVTPCPHAVEKSQNSEYHPNLHALPHFISKFTKITHVCCLQGTVVPHCFKLLCIVKLSKNNRHKIKWSQFSGWKNERLSESHCIVAKRLWSNRNLGKKTTFCFDLLVTPCFKRGDYQLSQWLLDPSHAVTCGQNSRNVILDASKQVFLNQRAMIC